MANLFRPPVVAILGHVDHGKTTLLDTIRKSRLAAKEHGGITQKIGGYEVVTGIKGYPVDRITFIDTPGHEAFTKLRARGATVADIALLLIDAKDFIKPQTIESISHIKAANIPFIVVLNKIDLPDANPDRVKIDLMKHDVIVEDKGGKIPSVAISAKMGTGVDELLEAILLFASGLNLTHDPKHPPLAFIIETNKDKRGYVASCVIKDGVLKIGDTIYAGQKQVKVKALVNDLGKNVREVIPSAPFELLGFNEMPEVGTVLTTSLSTVEQVKQEQAQAQVFDVESFLEKKEEKKLSLIVKADSQGSLDAITQALGAKENVNLILAAVGEIHESDVFLAKTTKAIIIGFNVAPTVSVREVAKQEKVIIKTYNIIYNLLDELVEVSELMKEKEEREKNLKGEGKILATFIINEEKVYGVKITKGKANLGDNAQIYRNNNVVGEAKLASLKMRAKPVPEVKKDQESGMLFSPELDIQVGDVVKFVL